MSVNVFSRVHKFHAHFAILISSLIVSIEERHEKFLLGLCITWTLYNAWVNAVHM